MSPSNSRLGPTGPKVLSNPAVQKEKRSHQTRPAQLPTPRKPQHGSTGDRDLETPARCTARSRDRQTLTPAPNGAGTRKARRGDSGSGTGTLWTLRTQLRAAEPAGPRSLLRARAGETPPPALRRRRDRGSEERVGPGPASACAPQASAVKTETSLGFRAIRCDVSECLPALQRSGSARGKL